jgi:hypothetical protein
VAKEKEKIWIIEAARVKIYAERKKLLKIIEKFDAWIVKFPSGRKKNYLFWEKEENKQTLEKKKISGKERVEHTIFVIY